MSTWCSILRSQEGTASAWNMLWKTWRCSRTMFHEHQTCCLFMSWTTHTWTASVGPLPWVLHWTPWWSGAVTSPHEVSSKRQTRPWSNRVLEHFKTLHFNFFNFHLKKSNLVLIFQVLSFKFSLNPFTMVAQTRQTEAFCLALLSSNLQRKDHPLRVLFLLFKSSLFGLGPSGS